MLSTSLGEAILHHNRWPKACGMSPLLLPCLEWGSTYVDVLLHNSIGVFDALLCAHKRAVVASNARLTALPSPRP